MSNNILETLDHSQLGKKSKYIDHYSPELLFPIPRSLKRNTLGLANSLPFNGNDIWHSYEMSWLNKKGKPEVAMARFIIPCTTENLIESKSMKLYLNSFNNTHFQNADIVIETITQDLTAAAKGKVTVQMMDLKNPQLTQIRELNGLCIDHLDVEIDYYSVMPDLLRTENETVQETIHSHLLKSNCLATGQPDWASIQIEYSGKKINHAALLSYLISYRNQHDFHEQVVERIFLDIHHHCKTEALTVKAYYTRRGGLDINPWRSNKAISEQPFLRLSRQ